MNGVHDMGGMHGMGPIPYEKNEPVFHARWESRVYALHRALGAWRRWNIDSGRYDLETLPPADYLRMSYYERWLAGIEKRVVRFEFATPAELKSGKAAAGFTRATPALTADQAIIVDRAIPSADQPSIRPLFEVGDTVRARNLQPAGHTRLPRYARGKTGEIVRDHGVYAFPDTNAEFKGEKRQHVYSVRFSARELWGANASARDFVYLDLWDDYLERT